jgi:ubiquinone/menaquinone biosynthesis C-methylase UbiE
MSQTATAYVMGHTDRERRRLALQASILQPFTEHLLRRAGISAGMHVLDIGCGVGDVSLLAASLVGRHGTVTSIDIDPDALSLAQQRASSSVLNNVTFVHSSVDAFQAEKPFDAVIGRHILIHLADPLGTLRQVHGLLRTGGVAAFHEYDFSLIHKCYPPCPLHDRLIQVFHKVLSRDGGPGMGTRMFHLLIQAGFMTPDCRVEYPVDGGPESSFYEWFAESYRSIYPLMKSRGLLEPDEDWADLDSLEKELRQEAVSKGASFASPAMIGAFARKP